jgi:hypothetical protein
MEIILTQRAKTWLVSYIWFVVVGFKTHFGWGLVLLFFPVAAIVFAWRHFQTAKKPLVVFLTSLLLLVLTLIWI